MGPFDWRGLVWLEDYDGSFHLRIKRKSRYADLCGWAKRIGMGIHPVYLRLDGTTSATPDKMRETYVKFWHPYKWRKDPVEYRKQREGAQQQALAAQQAFIVRRTRPGLIRTGSTVYLPASSSGPIQMFSYVEPPAPKKLSCDTSVVAPLVGWRRWSVDMFGSTLKSNNGTKWEPYTKLAAECKAGPSKADPVGLGVGCRGVHCTCGIYAYKEREAAMTGENAPTTETHIFGEVWLWGRVIECETGFRAQYGYPKSIVNTGGIAEQLSIAYGVKLIPLEAPCTTTP